jgi:hypothetical protein
MVDWAAREFAAWNGLRLRGLDDSLWQLAQSDDSLFLFDLGTAGVRCHDKPSASPLHRTRQALYRGFLERVLDRAELDGQRTIAISLADRSASRHGLPVFEYQKQRGAPSLLLPDVDLLATGFFAGPDYVDPVGFEEKRPEALFVGATTGGRLTADIVRSLEHPRLRAAMFFRDKPGVTFELPQIVQCDTEETVALIASLGLGSRRRPWSDHHAYRYLLSIDGNGANCSRVALGLRGQGVLMKYNSPYQLFYFYGLDAWRHYLPVRRDDDVMALLDQSAEAVDRDRRIAEDSAAFARDHLNEAACAEYTAALLSLYFRNV